MQEFKDYTKPIADRIQFVFGVIMMMFGAIGFSWLIPHFLDFLNDPSSSFFVKALSQFTDKSIIIKDHDAHIITIKSDYIAFYFALFLNLWIFTSVASIAKSCIFFGAELLNLKKKIRSISK